MPQRDTLKARASPFAISAAGHVIVIAALLALLPRGTSPAPTITPAPHEVTAPLHAPRIVFLSSSAPGGGGGGGGNRQSPPIRRAERRGPDRITLPIARPSSTSGRVDVPAPIQQIVLDARPLASGMIEQIGIPEGGVGFGTSQGPGFGGGAGDGVGTGVGPGHGPGFGSGEGGGIGGGLYRPGGSVTPPRVLWEVRPAYTSNALRERIQGLVILELVVRSDGRPTDIRVTRSLDARGLDQEAIRAVQQWRFEPGRLAETPVDVLVIVELRFSIR